MKVAVAKGDGIGPEIMEAVIKVFNEAKVGIATLTPNAVPRPPIEVLFKKSRLELFLFDILEYINCFSFSIN
jgi:hypothetical protein